ncbi:succinate--CoA ligase subunit alpha [Candidatus Bipolaricaulota bacterium]|nr:succinate--CoA ligase subunit alpha [Candidatus Bipolaricaulota bacterium]
MAILVHENTRVLVQGITGRVGSFQTKVMQEYGTNIVAGVTPGKGGTMVDGIPVYDLVEEALSEHEADVALSFVPARFAKDAAIEAIDNGIHFVVLTAEGIPDQDVLTVLNYAAIKGIKVLGPDTPGLVSPGKCKVGVHPDRVLKEGHVGLVSKSGALSYEVCKLLTEHGIGQSTIVGIGGGPLWGLTQREVLEMFEEDPDTKVVVMLGEVGGTMEHEAAALIEEHVTKPVISLVVGRAAPKGARMGHAGAIIEGEGETAASKIRALRNAGSLVAKDPAEILSFIKRLEVGVR